MGYCTVVSPYLTSPIFDCSFLAFLSWKIKNADGRRWNRTFKSNIQTLQSMKLHVSVYMYTRVVVQWFRHTSYIHTVHSFIQILTYIHQWHTVHTVHTYIQYIHTSVTYILTSVTYIHTYIHQWHSHTYIHRHTYVSDIHTYIIFSTSRIRVV